MWIYYSLESPLNELPQGAQNLINWTMTYRKDSEIPRPYGLWVYYHQQVQQTPVKRNYAKNKTRKVVWAVSHCNAKNNRSEYVKQLQNYIPVDVVGGCGPIKCERNNTSCFHSFGVNYKFYLAFENSNCIEYITEKFFFNALQ